MQQSELLCSVIADCGLTSLPTEDEVSRMSDEEKQNLLQIQKEIVVQLRERSHKEVEKLQEQIDKLVEQTKTIRITDMDECRESLPMLNPGSRAVQPHVKPIIGTLKKKAVSATPPRIQVPCPANQNVERRLRQINREIMQITRRFKSLNPQRFQHREPFRY